MDKKTFDLNVFAENVKKVQEDNHLTQKEFAEKIGIQPTNLSAFYNGKNVSLTLQHLYNIAMEFGVSTDELLSITPASKSDIAKMESAKDIVKFLVNLALKDCLSFQDVLRTECLYTKEGNTSIRCGFMERVYVSLFFNEFLPCPQDSKESILAVIDNNNGTDNYLAEFASINDSLIKIRNYHEEYLRYNKG